jgi:hypothetical protein
MCRVEIALENMRVDLSTTSAENQSLSSNVAELQIQLNDLIQQQLQVGKNHGNEHLRTASVLFRVVDPD